VYKVIITSVKVDPNVEFWESDSDIEDYIKETYIDTGKIISADTVYSDNGLEKICSIDFLDKTDWTNFTKDPVIQYQEKIKLRYNNYYRIAMSVNTGDISITKDLYSLYNDGIHYD
jgi:hypothetical protein